MLTSTSYPIDLQHYHHHQPKLDLEISITRVDLPMGITIYLPILDHWHRPRAISVQPSCSGLFALDMQRVPWLVSNALLQIALWWNLTTNLSLVRWWCFRLVRLEIILLSGVMVFRAASIIDTLIVGTSPTSHMLQVGMGSLTSFLKATCSGSIICSAQPSRLINVLSLKTVDTWNRSKHRSSYVTGPNCTERITCNFFGSIWPSKFQRRGLAWRKLGWLTGPMCNISSEYHPSSNRSLFRKF